MQSVLNRLLVLCLTLFALAHEAHGDDRPNILLLVADDLGYADIGVHGGLIDTPNIDSLANDGLLLTQFHASPLCSPTRAMLLSGNTNHAAGVARQFGLPVTGVSATGYESHLSDRIAALPTLLQDAGYRTYMVGKWHLGTARENWPDTAGFVRTYSQLQGGGSFFDLRSQLDGGSTYVQDGELADYPIGRFSTAVFTEKIIEFIESGKHEDQPFFAYVAYKAPHFPLQVPDEYLELYAGQYDDGYDELREENFAGLKRAGIVSQDATLPPRNANIRPWATLSSEEKRRESRKMEIYAALVDLLDDQIGVLLDYLRESNELDNTLVIFISDNGPAGQDFYNDPSWPNYYSTIRRNFDNAYEKMGTADSYVSYGPQWAEAGSPAFARIKGFMYQGGLVAPMIVRGPGVARRGEMNAAYITVMDIAPTVLDIAGAQYPDSEGILPMVGESMVEFLQGQSDHVHDDDYVTIWSHRGHALVRKGHWKILTPSGPFDETRFELYDLNSDPGESRDLREIEPGVYQELVDIWRAERKSLGIIVPADL